MNEQLIIFNIFIFPDYIWITNIYENLKNRILLCEYKRVKKKCLIIQEKKQK